MSDILFPRRRGTSLSLAIAVAAVAALTLYGCAAPRGASSYYGSYSGNPFDPDRYNRNPYDPGAASYDMRSNGW